MKDFIIRHKNNIFKALAVLFWVMLWHIASVLVGYSFLLSSPIEVVRALFMLCTERAFWLSIIGSISRISAGFFSAFFGGILLACAASRFACVKILLAPFMASIKSMPVASLTILLLLWLSGSQSLAWAISFIMVLPLIYNAAVSGIMLRDIKLLQMAKVFAVKPLKKFIYIDFPLVMPYITSVCAVALGLAWKSGIAAEVIGIVSNSLGGQIYNAKLLFSTENVLAITIVIIALSFMFERLVIFLITSLTRIILHGRRANDSYK